MEQKVESKDTLATLKVYSNKRFKDVVFERIGKDSFFKKENKFNYHTYSIEASAMDGSRQHELPTVLY